ncbi:MAG: ATP-binding cassette domain-containing protein [Polyangiales bacterium]
MSNAIEVEGLRKVYRASVRAPGLMGSFRQLLQPTYREHVAVRDVSFSIAAGERVAFVGQNGAGKSTTIKLLSGILQPDAGKARVVGFVPWRERTQLSYRIGTVFGQRSQLWYHLPVLDTFELLRHVYDQDGEAYRARSAMLIEAFSIGPHLHKPVRQLSLGERMRCELVASLLHAPDVLFLDEPTIGLDVAAKATIREVVRDESLRFGRTLLLTSHDTADMERVCERVIVIHDGGIVLDEPLARLRQRYIREKRITLQVAEAAPVLDLPHVRVVESAPHRLVLELDVTRMPVDALLHAVLRTLQVQDLTVEDPPMDEIVAAIYARGSEAAS